MTMPTKTVWNPDLARRIAADSSARVNEDTPATFAWRVVEGPGSVALQQYLLDLVQRSGIPDEGADFGEFLDLRAEIEAVRLIAHADYLAISEAQACPRCGQAPGTCQHTDPTPSFSGIADPGPTNRALRDTCLRRGETRRGELSLTRQGRIEAKKTQVVALMRQQLEEAAS